MVIENEQGYINLLNRLQDKSVCAVFVRDDNRNHPAESSVIAVSLFVDNEIHDVILIIVSHFQKVSILKNFSVQKDFGLMM